MDSPAEAKKRASKMAPTGSNGPVASLLAHVCEIYLSAKGRTSPLRCITDEKNNSSGIPEGKYKYVNRKK
jgi:hypothetical protein